MRVAIIGWAWLALQGREGSGYNLNCSELARGLALSGHSVFYLQSGMAYALSPAGVLSGAGAGKPFVRPREEWGGVRCFELVNSPNLAPSAWNFSNVTTETRDEASTQLVLQWLREINAEVVHIHSQEGLPLDLIPAIERAGIPVVVTLHNYWFVCPQVDLLHKEQSVCTDYDGGRRCVGCLPSHDARSLRRAKAMGDSLEYLLGLYRADVVRKFVYGVWPWAKSVFAGRLLTRFKPRSYNPDWLADPELAAGFETNAAFSHGGAASEKSGASCEQSARTGEIDHGVRLEPWEAPKDYERADADTNARMLDPSRRDVHLRVLNDYGRRRAAGIAALQAASLVTAPSDFLRRVHVTMGVPDEKSRWVRLGQPHFDQIHRVARRSPFYRVRPWDASTARRPLRFCFMGTTRPNKGLEVLARAIPLIDPDLRRRCHVTIHAAGLDWAFRRRLSRFPEVSVYGAYDLFQLISKAAGGGEYDVGILPHIWLENSPLVLLENLHAGKFVICSRLGGPVDWIVEPRDNGPSGCTPGNGLLFNGGDEHTLAAHMERCIRGDVVIPSAAEVHEVSIAGLQSYPGHVREVEGLYQSVRRR